MTVTRSQQSKDQSVAAFLQGAAQLVLEVDCSDIEKNDIDSWGKIFKKLHGQHLEYPFHENVIHNITGEVPIVFRGFSKKFMPKYAEVAGNICTIAKDSNETRHYSTVRFAAAPLAGNNKRPSISLQTTSGTSRTCEITLKDVLDKPYSYMIANGKESRGNVASQSPLQQSAEDVANGVIPPMLEALGVPEGLSEMPIVKAYLQSLEKRGDAEKAKPTFNAHQVFVLNSNNPVHTQMHFDTYDNVYFNLHGLKIWHLGSPLLYKLLIPSGKFDCNYSEKVSLGKNGELDFLDQDLARWKSKLFAKVHVYPGDVLIVPMSWWHLVETKSVEIPGRLHLSVAFNCLFQAGTTLIEDENEVKEVDAATLRRDALRSYDLATSSLENDQTQGPPLKRCRAIYRGTWATVQEGTQSAVKQRADGFVSLRPVNASDRTITPTPAIWTPEMFAVYRELAEESGLLAFLQAAFEKSVREYPELDISTPPCMPWSWDDIVGKPKPKTRRRK